jgi:flagellar biosynthesis protein FlhA
VSILETLADAAVTSKDIDHLTEAARSSLGRSITVRLLDDNDELPLITFSRQVEEQLIQAVHPGERGNGAQFMVDPALVRKLVPAATRIVENLTQQGVTPVLLVTPMIRHHVKRLLDRFLPSIVVLSHNEIQPTLRVRAVGTIDPEA